MEFAYQLIVIPTYFKNISIAPQFRELIDYALLVDHLKANYLKLFQFEIASFKMLTIFMNL